MSARVRGRRAGVRPVAVARAGAAVVAALAVAVGATACVSREADAAVGDPGRVAASELTGVVLKVGDQKGGTESLMRASGELDGTPYRVEFSTFTSGPPQVEAANAGKIDFAVVGNTPPVFGAANHARFRVVSAYGGHGEGDQILVPAGSPVQDVAGLKGKKVAVAKSTSAHGNLLLQLRKAGLTLADVQPVFLDPSAASAAFRRGDVDAWAIWDPYTAITQTQGGTRTLATAVGVADGLNFGVASSDTLGDARRVTALADFLTRLAKAGNWSREHPAEWAAAYAKEVGISPEAATLAEGRSVMIPRPLADTVASEQKLTDAFVDDHDIAGPVDIGSYVDERFAADIAPTITGAPS